jgi:hypothetical protein
MVSAPEGPRGPAEVVAKPAPAQKASTRGPPHRVSDGVRASHSEPHYELQSVGRTLGDQELSPRRLAAHSAVLLGAVVVLLGFLVWMVSVKLI